jgi:sec-independent protein translocase protein TatA
LIPHLEAAMPFGLGFGETILILFVVLLFFGPKRLPEAASSLGKGIREFKRAVSGVGEELMAPASTIAAAPAPPPHATLAGPGADPNAVSVGTSEPVAEPPRLSESEAPAAASADVA